MYMKNKKILFLSLSVVLVIFVFVISLTLANMPVMKINGSEKQTISLNSKYKEQGITNKTLFGKTNHKSNIKGKVNNKKIGTYKIEYTNKYLFFTIKKVREVKVVDKIKPTITLSGGNEVYVCKNKEYEELGYMADDNYDGDLTKKVKIIKTDDSIKYIVKDSSNNKTKVIRKIIKNDIEKPIITLKGNDKISIIVNGTFTEPGYSALDNCDGDITNSVTVTGSVNTNIPGEYKINYSVKDSSNNEDVKVRTVIVRDKVKALPGTFKSSMVYLTFDDGPSNLTTKILDILKEEGVKATFFVIGRSDSLNSVIKRAYDEGHTIALHSYTHNYNKIYTSSTAYFDDLYQIQNKVKNITGFESKIIRFPGGSSNTVSKYNKGIMTRLTNEVTEKGFRYYDWNISSGDAGATKDSRTIYNNVIKGVSPNKTNIVLMHDSSDKTYTLNALSDIIKELKRAGYSFGKIDYDTPQIKHGVNN